MEPKYDLVPIIQNPIIDPGDTVKISLYITGWGDVDSQKFYTNHHHPEIISKNGPGSLTCSIKDARSNDTGEYIQPVSGEKHLQNHELDSIGAYISLSQSYFKSDPRKSFPQRALPHLMGEMTHDDHPPIHYELNTRDDATPGDYKILFGLTYSNDEKVYQDKEEIEIHVNSWREEHQSMLELVGVFGVLASIGILLFSSGIL